MSTFLERTLFHFGLRETERQQPRDTFGDERTTRRTTSPDMKP